MHTDLIKGGAEAPEPLVVRNLSAQQGGVEVLKSVTFQLNSGSLALVGPNGSGKSTLLQCLASIHPFVASVASVYGKDLRTYRGQAAARAFTGYLAQNPRSFSNLTVSEACLYGAWLKGVPNKTRRSSVEFSLKETGVLEFQHKKLSQLSGGQRRLAHLAMCLVHDPALILLDEPTSGLDAEYQDRVRELLARMSESRVVIFSTHLADDILGSEVRNLALLRSGDLQMHKVQDLVPESERVRFRGSADILQTLFLQ